METKDNIQFKTHIALLPHFDGYHYLFIPKKVAKYFGEKLNVRLICTLNNKISFQCGLVALSKGDAYISISKKRMKDLGVALGDELEIKLVRDESKYGVEVPEELNELFLQDEEGFKRFEGLTPSKQRYIIQYISTVKSTQLRIERSIRLIGNLKKTPLGKESFRVILGIED